MLKRESDDHFDARAQEARERKLFTAAAIGVGVLLGLLSYGAVAFYLMASR